jgi:hypothetical protein
MRELIIKKAIDSGYTYDSLTGFIYGPKSRTPLSRHYNGYIVMNVTIGKDDNGKRVRRNLLGHQFAWYFTYGSIANEIDHINRITSDNRISNLREVSHQQNLFNTEASGISFHNVRKKWRSYIKLNGVYIHLGMFNTKDEAISSRKLAKEKYHKI